MTQFQHRLLIIVPVARQAAFNTWWAVNIDTVGAGDKTFTTSLNASGLEADPPTHYWACMSLTSAELKKVVLRLLQLAGITPPADWDTFTRDEKRDWLRGQIPAIRTAIGVRLLVDDNDRQWDDYSAVLGRAGLKVIQLD